MIKLRMTASVALRLETAVKETRGLEFSGLGFAKQERGGLVIYDVEVLNVGSEAYTEIDPRRVFALMEREDSDNLRVWFHRHPIGDGRPGRHNWSGRDELTIRTTPLGGIPQIVKWSISIVRTPGGWVGRLDNHIDNETIHLNLHPVLPDGFIQEIRDMTPIRRVAIPIEKKGKKASYQDPGWDAGGTDWYEEKWYNGEIDYDEEIENQLSFWG